MHVPNEIAKANISFVISICLSTSVTVTFTGRNFLKFSSWTKQEFPWFFLKLSSHFHVHYTSHVFSSSRKVASKFFMVQWTLIFPSVHCSSRWSLPFGLTFLKPICIFVPFPMFQTPRPFISGTGYCLLRSTYHEAPRYVIFTNLRTPPPSQYNTSPYVPLLPLSRTLYPKPHTTISIMVQRLNSNLCINSSKYGVSFSKTCMYGYWITDADSYWK